MERTKLIDALNTVKPALADKDLIPVYTHFCFKGDTVFAFNDIVGIETKCDIGFKAAVNGDRFLAWLSKSRFESMEFEFQPDDTLLVLGGKRSELKLPVLMEDDYLFDMPDYKKGAHVVFDRTYLDGLKLCLISAESEYTMGDRAGVRLKVGDGVALLSTDGRSISRYIVNDMDNHGVKMPKGMGEIVMPYDFCENMVKLADKDEKVDVYLSDKFVVASIGNGKTLVYAKTPVMESNQDLEGIIEKQLENVPETGMVAMPNSFRAALQRALPYLADDENVGIKCDVEEQRLYLTTESDYGRVDDDMKIKEPHDDVKALILPKAILQVLDHCKSLYVTKPCMILTDERGFVHIVSNPSVQ